MSKKAFDFNQGMAQLEQIVDALESGELSLEDALKKFEQGVALVRQCRQVLSDAEQKVLLLSEQDDYTDTKPLED